MDNELKAKQYDQLMYEYTKTQNQISSIKGESLDLNEAQLKGLVLEDLRIVPPSLMMSSVLSKLSSVVMFSTAPFQPYLIPITSDPYSLTDLKTKALITEFKPGQSPPPVSTPIRMDNILA